jgi:hypothetical protein
LLCRSLELKAQSNLYTRAKDLWKTVILNLWSVAGIGEQQQAGTLYRHAGLFLLQGIWTEVMG